MEPVGVEILSVVRYGGGMSPQTASVEVLSAEVRVLMVGSRQVTLSVYRQLDQVGVTEIEPFGRVNADDDKRHVQVVGRATKSGELVRSQIALTIRRPFVDVAARDLIGGSYPLSRYADFELVVDGNDVKMQIAGHDWQVDTNLGRNDFVLRDEETKDRVYALARKDIELVDTAKAIRDEWISLPLIVLAGLK
jgi:hypothetical protein